MATVSIPATLKTGTLVFNFNFSLPYSNNLNFTLGIYGNGRGLRLQKTGETHTWIWMDGLFPDPRKINNSDIIAVLDQDYGFNPGTADWTSYNIGMHECRYIYDGRILRIFIDGFAYPGGVVTASDLDRLPWVNTTSVRLDTFDSNGLVTYDTPQIFDGQFVYPAPNIRYEQYVNDVAWTGYTYQGGQGYIPASYRNGIIVSGRNANGAPITLSQIANAISNPALFTYNPTTKIADCYTNLVLDSGCYLAMDGETLNIHSTIIGDLELRLRDTADLDIISSAVTSPLLPFRWIFACERFYNPWPWGYPTPSNMDTHFFDAPNGNPFNYQGCFKVINSVISNSGNLYIPCAMQLQLKNSTFSLATITAGGPHPDSGRNRVASRSGNSHSFSLRTDLIMDEQVLQGLNISSMDATPINLIFLGGDETVKYKEIRDSELNGNIIMRKSEPTQGAGPRRNSMSLINVQTTGTVTMDTIETRLFRKYYLDVLVIDSLGNPVQNATVTVTNNVDPNYPAQNLFDGKRWTNWRDEGYLIEDGYYNAIDSVALEKGRELISTLTGPNGHTPLPTDALNTIVITESKQENNYKASNLNNIINYGYNITATHNGKTNTVSNVVPDATWYRPDPLVPTQTITIQLNETVCPALMVNIQAT